ncbi:hypothetical protein LUZ60_004920 [Juncus effusus]|nr:hypothetical protein LUZ60_004920 [Juncus effusus]
MLKRWHLHATAIKKLPPFSLLHLSFFSHPNSSSNSLSRPPLKEWENLLAPFDLHQLRLSFNRITPKRLCQLLNLPLDISTCLNLFDWVSTQKGYVNSFSVYFTLVRKLAIAGEFKTVLKLLLRSKDEGIVLKESIFILLICSYGNTGFPGNACKLLDEMSEIFKCEPTFRSYNAALDVLVHSNCYEETVNLFQKMLFKGISPTVFSFSVSIKALCRIGKVDSACDLLRSMARYGCVPDSILYQTLIHALCKSSSVEKAVRLFEEMILMGCLLDVDTFNDIIFSLCKIGKIKDAAKMLDRMILRKCNPNSHTYGYLLHAMCKKGQVDEAKALLNRIPDLNTNNQMVHSLINQRINSSFDD